MSAQHEFAELFEIEKRLMAGIRAAADAPPRRLGVSWRAAALLAAVAGVVVGGALVSGGPGRAPDAAAAAALRSAAVTAEGQPALPPLTEGRYMYRKWLSSGFADDRGWPRVNGGWTPYPLPPADGCFEQAGSDPECTVPQPSWRAWVRVAYESFIAADGTTVGRRTSISGPRFETAADRMAWEQAGSPRPWETPITLRNAPEDRFTFFFPGRDHITEAELRALPPDPAKLRDIIEPNVATNATWSHEKQMFDDITQMLMIDPLQPEVRAALYDVLASLPGIELLGRVDKQIGRPGVAIGITDRGYRFEAIFDPETADLIGQGLNGYRICCWQGWEVVDSTAPRPAEPASGPAAWTLPSVKPNVLCLENCVAGSAGPSW